MDLNQRFYLLKKVFYNVFNGSNLKLGLSELQIQRLWYQFICEGIPAEQDQMIKFLVELTGLLPLVSPQVR